MRKLMAITLIIIGAVLLGSKIVTGNFLLFGSTTVQDERIVNLSDVRNVNIQTKSINVKTIPGKSDEAVIRLSGKSNKDIGIKAEVKNGTLYVESTYKAKWFPISIGYNDVELIIELPEREWESVVIHSGSGNNYVKTIHSNQLSIEANSGNIFAGDIKAKSANVKLYSGNVKIDGFTIEELSVKGVSGNTTIVNGESGIKAESTSGNIDVKLDRITNDIKLTGKSGNVTLKTNKLPENAEIVLQTGSGNKKVDWPGVEMISSSENKFSGRIGNGGVNIELETKSGNVRVRQ